MDVFFYKTGLLVELRQGGVDEAALLTFTLPQPGTPAPAAPAAPKR